MTSSRVGTKSYKSYDEYQLYTAGFGKSISVHGRGDLDVAFKSDSAGKPGAFHTVVLLKDVPHAPQVASSLVSLRAHYADGLVCVGKGSMISIIRGDTAISS